MRHGVLHHSIERTPHVLRGLRGEPALHQPRQELLAVARGDRGDGLTAELVQHLATQVPPILGERARLQAPRWTLTSIESSHAEA